MVAKYSTIDQVGCLEIGDGQLNSICTGDFLDVSSIDEWIKKGKLKGLIIVGAGRHFSTGADLGRLRAYGLGIEEELQKGKDVLNYLESLPIVVVAAIKGACLGAGFELALACHYRFCARNSVFSFPEVTHGLIPGLDGSYRLSKLLGACQAKKYIFTGQMIYGEEALRVGIVEKIVDKDQLIEECVKFINDMTENISDDQRLFLSEIFDGYKNNPPYTASMSQFEGRAFTELILKDRR